MIIFIKRHDIGEKQTSTHLSCLSACLDACGHQRIEALPAWHLSCGIPQRSHSTSLHMNAFNKKEHVSLRHLSYSHLIFARQKISSHAPFVFIGPLGAKLLQLRKIIELVLYLATQPAASPGDGYCRQFGVYTRRLRCWLVASCLV